MKKLFNWSGFGTYWRLLSTIKHYRIILMWGMLGTIVMSLFDAAFTWLLRPVIDKGFVSRDMLFIHWLPVVVLLLLLGRSIASFVSSYFINRVARNVVMTFRQKIFSHFLTLPASFYDKSSSGNLLSTIIYNVEQVAQASSDTLIISLRELALVIGLVVVMLLRSWQLTLSFLCVFPFIMWIIKVISVRLRHLSVSVQKTMSDITHIASEAINGYRIIRIYRGEDYEREKFDRMTKLNQQRELKVVVTNSIGTSLVQLLLAVSLALILYFAMRPSLEASAGSFVSIVVAIVMLLKPVRRLVMVNSYIQKGIAGAQSIFELLDQKTEIDSGKQRIRRTKGSIRFSNVCFSYPNTKAEVLKNISFLIKPNQMVAIVGHSGMGKSTLVNLLPRFYEITAGVIQIDGIDIREYALSDLRHQFSVVSQNTILFNDTVARNIAYGCKLDDAQAMIKAAQAAHAIEFIERLPEGFETVIGEDGVLLSGGQRQRIAIARAVLNNSPILILDEATSALDTYTEKKIQAALEDLMWQRTTLVIAHRLSTIEKADWILVLDHGVLVEQGKHDQLIKQGGFYTQLHNMQFLQRAS